MSYLFLNPFAMRCNRTNFIFCGWITWKSTITVRFFPFLSIQRNIFRFAADLNGNNKSTDCVIAKVTLFVLSFVNKCYWLHCGISSFEWHIHLNRPILKSFPFESRRKPINNLILAFEEQTKWKQTKKILIGRAHVLPKVAFSIYPKFNTAKQRMTF